MTLSVVVATFGRHEVLVETIRSLLDLEDPAEEIVVVDQNAAHPTAVGRQLQAWAEANRIVWLRRAVPSIPGAMNEGLVAATSDVVLFVDDDIAPRGELVAAHRSAHRRGVAEVVAGQLLQPGESPAALSGDAFTFRSTLAQPVREFIGANFSVRRGFALSVGGFDENFVAVAYRYEAEFSDRVRAGGGSIWFEPAASARHLKASRGGTRAYGDHLRTLRPAHAVGEYYYLLTGSGIAGRWRRLVARPFRAIRTKHHLKRPWWIPLTLFAESAGFVQGVVLALRGRRLLHTRTVNRP